MNNLKVACVSRNDVGRRRILRYRVSLRSGSLATAVCLTLILLSCARFALGQVNRPNLVPAPPPSYPRETAVNTTATQTEAQPTPKWVAYRFFFTHLDHLNKIANDLEALGKTAEGEASRTYEQHAAGLSDDEGVILREVALECSQAVKDLDRRLLVAIRAVGDQPGRVHGVDRSDSRERASLWQERTEIILAAIDTLRSRLGTAAFERLDAYVDETSCSSIRSVPAPAIAPPAPVGTDVVPYLHVYSRTTLSAPNTAISECGTEMIDQSGYIQASYPLVEADCAFWHWNAAISQFVLVGQYVCEGNPTADCLAIPFATVSGDWYTTTGLHVLQMKATPECNDAYWDPLQYSLPAGTELPFLNDDGDVFSHGDPACWAGPRSLLAGTQSANRLAGPLIKVTPLSGDFGPVAIGTSVDGDFYVQNVGYGTLTGTASTADPFSIVDGGSYSLTAGLSQAVTVRFKPTQPIVYNGTVTFTGGGGTTAPVKGLGVAVHTLGVAASGTTSAVTVNVSPHDNDFKYSGTTPFTLNYNDKTVVTLTAPSASGPTTFSNWSGCTSAAGTTCTLNVIADNLVVTAVYGPTAHTLTVYSSPDPGAAVTVTPTDRNSQGNGVTTFARLYDVDKVVTLTASTVAGYTFSNWLGCDSASGSTCTVTMSTDKNVTAAYAAIPARTLTVASSNPSSGVAITVSPNDKNGRGNGTTPFTRTFSNGTSVTLVAPANAGSNGFISWSGCDSSPAATCTVTMNNLDKTVTANYGPAVTQQLTVASTNPSSGVGVTVSPNDKNGNGNGATQFTRTFNKNTAVTLTAATTVGNNTFASWTGCDSSPAATCTITMGGDKTVTANYVSPRTLTVASSNPSSGVAITVAPNDRNGQSNGSTQFTRSYNNNASVTLTAPSTSGANPFGAWSGCDATSGTTCTVTVNADKTVTANYAPPRTLTVASSPSSVSITVDKLDQNGQGNGTTQFPRIYTNGVVVTLTAPSTAPDGSTSPVWSGCDGGSGAICTVTMDADKTVTAVYRMPVITVRRINIPNPRVVGPYSFTATVELSAAAQTALTVNLSSDSSAATVPSSTSVPQGATVSQPFTVTVPAAVSASTPVTITAIYQNTPVSAAFSIEPPLAVTGISGQGDKPLGTAITNAVTVSGGIGPYSYRFVYAYGGSWYEGQAYGASNSWTWTPAQAGSYSMQVWVKNAASTAAYDAYNGYSFNVLVDDAAVVTTSGIPSSMAAGQTAAVSVTMRNTGTTTWVAATGYKLGDAAPTGGLFGPARVPVGADVPPGGQATFNFTLTAPTIPGTYTFGWRMLQEMVHWFGAYAPYGGYSITVAAPVDDAVVVTTSGIPSSMTPGQTAAVSVTMRNSGTTTWVAGTGYKLGDAAPTAGLFGPARVPVGADVPPGGQATFNFTLTAPTTPGTYTFGWRMLQEMVRWFGAYAPTGGYSITVAAPVDDAVVVTTTGIPSNMTPGQTAAVSVTMRNTGTTTWVAATGYKLGDAAPTAGLFGPARVPVGADVPPGGQATFNFTLTAPATPGTYTFGWRMLQEMVRWFGAYAPYGGYSITVGSPPPPPVVSVIWLQPGYMAGFGGNNNLVIAGSVTNVPAGTPVSVGYYQWSTGPWLSAPDTTTDDKGIWYTFISNANFADNYSVFAVSSGVQSPGCWTGPDANRYISCP